MYETFDRWDALAAEPSAASSSSSMDGEGRMECVGRDIVSSTCNLRASAALRAKIRSRGGDEVYEWERWLRRELWLRNQRPPSQEVEGATDSPPQPWQGRDFFVEEIGPAAVALGKFRAGRWDELSFLSKAGKKTMTKRQRDTVVAQLDFLRDVTSGVASAKEAEIVVLELLLRAEKEDGSMLSRYLDEILPLIEKWTLWMSLERPSPMQRHARVFALLDAMDDFDSLGSSELSDDGGEMIQSLKESMDEYDFGASAGGKRLATAILKRLSAHLMVEGRKNLPNGSSNVSTVEQIQQLWSGEEEREEWSNRIGNLALVSSASTRRSRTRKGSSDSSWEGKRTRFKKEPWILTRQLAELDQWDASAVRDRQTEVLSLIDVVFGK